MPEENTNKIEESLNLIQQAVLTLDKKIEVQGKRIEQLENQARIEAPAQNFQQPDFSSLAPPPPPPAAVQEQTQTIFPAESPAKSQDSLEENIGGKWFARIGITALVLGVSFFLKYAFDNDWIGETGRIIIGIIIGLALLGAGEKTIRKYFVYGQIISGGGIAVLYLSIFCAFNFYQLIGSLTAFFIMIIITAVGIALSLRYDALALVIVAIVGGFATPLMASSGVNNQIGLLSYLVLLDLAILAVAIFKKWNWLNVIGFLGTALLFSLWGAEYYTRQDLGTTMYFLTLFFLIFSISSLIYNLVKKEKSTGVEQLLTWASALVYFGASFGLLDDDYHIFMGFFALVLAVYYFIWAYLVRSLTPEDENLYGFLAFLTVGFVTLAIPLQFEQNVITIAWVIEAVLLMLIGARLNKKAIILFSLFVSGLAIYRYFLLDIAEYNKDSLLIFNNVFLTACIIIAGAYLMAFLVYAFSKDDNLKTGQAKISKGSLVAMFVIVANFMTIFSISHEIVKSYDRDINVIREQQSKAISSFNAPKKMGAYDNDYYDSNEYKLGREKIEKLENRSSIALSIFWLIYSIILLAVGIIGKYKGVRLGGLALLILAILKLFFYDLWSLGTLYRIISSISLGAVLLAISFVYQKYKNTIKEII
ncbi:MAG TPA: DUF2339 domain-containing protein [Candidatus Moranbacteria bacterium]|nr:DUF2339 domain-containing protein [Candidatus Moranbacteria bacterium]HRY28258.1 DUF2339 domain-containing protein [Candidatus Moranbacteria bacterium]HSA08347.1 DUF2339 domain-containing protein [Candidatus Moranbacteria bacterium]